MIPWETSEGMHNSKRPTEFCNKTIGRRSEFSIFDQLVGLAICDRHYFVRGVIRKSPFLLCHRSLIQLNVGFDVFFQNNFVPTYMLWYDTIRDDTKSLSIGLFIRRKYLCKFCSSSQKDGALIELEIFFVFSCTLSC